MFLQINGGEFVDGDAVRLTFRPVVRVFTQPPDPCVPTLEIIDNGTGRTSILFAGTPRFTSPPEPDRQ